MLDRVESLRNRLGSGLSEAKRFSRALRCLRGSLLLLPLASVACGGVISGVIQTTGDLATAGAAADAPAVTSAYHGPWSSLPTGFAFDPTTAVDAERLPAWVEAGLGIRIESAGTVVGPDGRTLRRFQQTHGGLPVRGAVYTAHLEEGRVAEVTGIAFDGVDVDPRPDFPTEDAWLRVTARWPELDPVGNPRLEVLPVAEEDGVRFHLVHRLEAWHGEDWTAWAIYVDAHTGEIRDVEPLMMPWTANGNRQETGSGVDVEGRRRAFGTQHSTDIQPPDDGLFVEELREGYRLFDTERNIHTMSLDGAQYVRSDVFEERDGRVRRKSWEYLLPAHDLIEEDNVWEADPDAVEVHWGLARTYDYFLSAHGRAGWDGNNGYTPAVVRYSRGMANALLWSSTGTLVFGDGGSFGRPFTSLDIVAHEFTHLLTRDIVALSRKGEAGSLEEALADMFATAVTFWNGQGSWSIGWRIIRPGGIRPLHDPQSRAMPDTYEGRYWEEYQTEAGFALHLKELTRHNNSTVGGYWFYLLSEGGEGENDIEEEYEIEPIGMRKATDIVYRALFRLHPMATYETLREATIHVARSRYGRCSEELRQVTNAWNAVGVGEPFCDCFEGSFTYVVEQSPEEPVRARFYVRGDDYAVEMTADDGTNFIMNATAGDPYRHVQGHPIPEFWQKLFYHRSRTPLVGGPSKPMTRREYLRYRNRHRTGRSGELGPYTTHEYRMEDATVWSTEDVCMDISDYMGLVTRRSPEVADAMRQVFFGFPVRLSRPGQFRVWVEDLREHKVDDRVFQP